MSSFFLLEAAFQFFAGHWLHAFSLPGVESIFTHHITRMSDISDSCQNRSVNVFCHTPCLTAAATATAAEPTTQPSVCSKRPPKKATRKQQADRPKRHFLCEKMRLDTISSGYTDGGWGFGLILLLSDDETVEKRRSPVTIVWFFVLSSSSFLAVQFLVGRECSFEHECSVEVV